MPCLPIPPAPLGEPSFLCGSVKSSLCFPIPLLQSASEVRDPLVIHIGAHAVRSGPLGHCQKSRAPGRFFDDAFEE